MKKQELIHLHGLLAQVQNHYEAESGTEVDHDEYEELGVKPTSIHLSWSPHRRCFGFYVRLRDGRRG
ncbi:metal-binding protein [Halogeometricum sp. wsp3]|nr:metal-binding protein [Halogeometricum sp. wsp3]